MTSISKAISSSERLRSKKELIEEFLSSVNAATNVDEEWQNYVRKQKAADLAEIIAGENLKAEETERFVDSAFRDGSLRTTGTDIDRILPPMSRFGGGNRQEKKAGVIEKLKKFFDKYFGLV